MEICDSSKGLLVSLGAHLIFFLLVGAAGYQAYQKQQAQDPIYTVEIVSGSPYHGYGDVPGAHLGNGNPPAPAAAQQQAAPQESAPRWTGGRGPSDGSSLLCQLGSSWSSSPARDGCPGGSGGGESGRSSQWGQSGRKSGRTSGTGRE